MDWVVLNFISPFGFYRVTFATSVFISYYFLLKPLYYSFNLSPAVICVYLSCCCINKLLRSQVPDRSVSVSMTLSDLEKWDARGPIFSGAFPIVRSFSVTYNDQIRNGNIGEGGAWGVFIGVIHAPSQGCRTPMSQKIFGTHTNALAISDVVWDRSTYDKTGLRPKNRSWSWSWSCRSDVLLRNTVLLRSSS